MKNKKRIVEIVELSFTLKIFVKTFSLEDASKNTHILYMHIEDYTPILKQYRDNWKQQGKGEYRGALQDDFSLLFERVQRDLERKEIEEQSKEGKPNAS